MSKSTAQTPASGWIGRAKSALASALTPNAASQSRGSPGTDSAAGKRPVACRGDVKTCAQLFPQEFFFCPFCGAPLEAEAVHPAPPLAAAETEIRTETPAPVPAPSVAPSCSVSLAWRKMIDAGTAEMSGVRSEGDERSGHRGEIGMAERIPAPGSGRLLFTPADATGSVFAVDMLSGSVWRVAAKSAWREIGRSGAACSLPLWSAGPAHHNSGVVLPADDGVVVLTLRDTVKTTARSKAGKAVGAPIAVAGGVAAPVVGPRGLIIVWLRPDGEGWEEIPVEDAPRDDPGPLGRPCPTLGDGVVWAGVTGHIGFRMNDHTLTARWRPWPVDVAAAPWCRPFRENGRLPYQLARDRGRAPYLALAMVSPDKTGRYSGQFQSNRLDGPFSSSGKSAFFLHRRCKSAPWERKHEDFAPVGAFTAPILAIRSEPDAAGTELILHLTTNDLEAVFGSDQGPPHRPAKADVYVHSPLWGSQLLLSGLSIITPFDLAPLTLDGRLGLYDAQGKAIHLWPGNITSSSSL